MKELSIFIDESGDFGHYSFHSPYYIITMVFHNQAEDIQNQISHFDKELSYLGLNNFCVHTGLIIRKEEVYKEMDIFERRRIFNKMMAPHTMHCHSRAPTLCHSRAPALCHSRAPTRESVCGDCRVTHGNDMVLRTAMTGRVLKSP